MNLLMIKLAESEIEALEVLHAANKIPCESGAGWKTSVVAGTLTGLTAGRFGIHLVTVAPVLVLYIWKICYQCTTEFSLKLNSSV
jgi:hypothetical protein